MDLDVDPAIDGELISDLRDAAADVGLPLERFELLGQDGAVAQAFVDAAAEGRAEAMLDRVDWDHLETVRTRRHVNVAAWVDMLAPESTTSLQGKEAP